MTLTVDRAGDRRLAIAAMVVLWPDSDKVPRDANPYSGQGVSTINAKVTGVEPVRLQQRRRGP